MRSFYVKTFSFSFMQGIVFNIGSFLNLNINILVVLYSLCAFSILLIKKYLSGHEDYLVYFTIDILSTSLFSYIQLVIIGLSFSSIIRLYVEDEGVGGGIHLLLSYLFFIFVLEVIKAFILVCRYFKT